MTKMSLSQIRQIARKNLTRNSLNYYESGSDYEQTLFENCKAYDRLKLCPQVVIANDNRKNIDLTTEVLGCKVNIPICIAPTAMQKMAHLDGEIGSAKAAFEYGTFMGVSTLSTTSYGDISCAVPDCLYIMQLYIYEDKAMTTRLIKSAEKAGFKAIALTVDTPILGQRIADVKDKFKLPSQFTLANYSDDKDLKSVSSESTSGLMEYVNKNIEGKLSWKDVEWLKGITNLPILLKGIMTSEDAIECIKHDIKGIIVSNHGGRQLDGVPATIEALPEVVRAVQGKIPVFVDGGIRRGSDVFKALALGAKAVFIGRPVLYGLAYNGAEGVKEIFKILEKELKDVMSFTGCSSIKDINVKLVRHETDFGIKPTTTLSYDWNWEPDSEKVVCIEDIKFSAMKKGFVIDKREEFRNNDAFMRFSLRPRRLRGIEKPNTCTKIFGKNCGIPIIINVSNKQMFSYLKQVFNTSGAYLEVSANQEPNQMESDYFVNVNFKQDRNTFLRHVLEQRNNSSVQCRGFIVNISENTWDDVMFIKSALLKNTQSPPIIIKGVISKEIAIDCLKNSVDGIIVSNPCESSQRWLTPTAIDMLPEIVAAVNSKIPVFLEGGIRKGTDILKALALGATAVFIDKPIQWGYAHQGEKGIESVMKILKEELERALYLAGTQNVEEITSSLVAHESYYWNIGYSSSKL